MVASRRHLEQKECRQAHRLSQRYPQMITGELTGKTRGTMLGIYRSETSRCAQTRFGHNNANDSVDMTV